MCDVSKRVPQVSSICCFQTMAALAEGGQDHGALVQQILETQKELEDVNKRQQHKTAIEIVINFFVLLVMLKREFNELF